MHTITTQEKVINSNFYPVEVDGEKREPTAEEIADEKLYFSTKDKGVAIFLNARGFPIMGWQRVEQSDGRSKPRSVVVVYFPGGGVTRSAMIEYHSRDKPDQHNVNGKCYNTAMRTINSIFQN